MDETLLVLKRATEIWLSRWKTWTAASIISWLIVLPLGFALCWPLVSAMSRAHVGSMSSLEDLSSLYSLGISSTSVMMALAGSLVMALPYFAILGWSTAEALRSSSVRPASVLAADGLGKVMPMLRLHVVKVLPPLLFVGACSVLAGFAMLMPSGFGVLVAAASLLAMMITVPWIVLRFSRAMASEAILLRDGLSPTEAYSSSALLVPALPSLLSCLVLGGALIFPQVVVPSSWRLLTVIAAAVPFVLSPLWGFLGVAWLERSAT